MMSKASQNQTHYTLLKSDDQFKLSISFSPPRDGIDRLKGLPDKELPDVLYNHIKSFLHLDDLVQLYATSTHQSGWQICATSRVTVAEGLLCMEGSEMLI